MSILNEMFDHIYVINLKHRTDKMEYFDNNAKKIGLKYTRFEAQNHDDVKAMYPDAEGKDAKALGKMGCMMSHREITRMALENGWDRVLIFEDDIKFDDNFEEQFRLAKKELEEKFNDWNFLQLGNFSWSSKKGQMKKTPVGDYWSTFQFSYGTGCHALEKSAYETFINFCNRCMYKHIDIFLSSSGFYVSPGINSYMLTGNVLKKRLMKQGSVGKSDVNGLQKAPEYGTEEFKSGKLFKH